MPLYLVIAGGCAASAARHGRCATRTDGRAGEDAARPLSSCALAAFLVLYALQALYSKDFDTALEQVVFFLVPFALLFALLREVRWTPRAWCSAASAVLVALALVFVRDRLLGVRAPRAVLEPEGDRREPVRVLLPRQLGLLGPERLRALPGAGDARGHGVDAVEQRAPRVALGRGGRARGAVGRAWC